MQIPRIVIAATQSGAGKTTIVTGLIAALRERGLKVQSFKIGPDYIDPGYHALASGRAAQNLDSWLVPQEKLTGLFAQEMQDADIAVIEGVMGLYDGGRNGISSTAQIAKLLKAPVLLVIDAKSMGASAAAIALGFREYDKDVNLAGVILNRLGSATHEAMIREAMASIQMPVFGALRRSEELGLPERHLGLLPTQENTNLAVIEQMQEAVSKQVDIDGIVTLAKRAPEFAAVPANAQQSDKKVCRIGVARDEAFSFYYPASLAMLEKFGAELVPFSPLHDAEVPNVDALLIGGGFPEMFAEQLSNNITMRQRIKQAADAGMPIYAECGGYMYLMQSLRDFAGKEYAMAGVFASHAVMKEKLQTVGYITAKLQRNTILGAKGTEIQGHEFHFSVEENKEEVQNPPFLFIKMRTGRTYPAGQLYKRTLGSYLHLHFAGCENAAKNLVHNALEYRRERGRHAKV